MFTGIIEVKGTVKSVAYSGGAATLVIEAESSFWKDVKLGESIAVDGVCLTVTRRGENSGNFDVSRETLDRAITGKYRAGSVVNLEKALRPTDRLGGHFVQGHVDGVGRFIDKKTIGENIEMDFEVPSGLERYIVDKGSISINGISLTAARVLGRKITIAVIPHTLQITSLEQLHPGDPVNIECDVIAKYTEKLLISKGESNPDANKGLNLKTLSEKGFL